MTPRPGVWCGSSMRDHRQGHASKVMQARATHAQWWPTLPYPACHPGRPGPYACEGTGATKHHAPSLTPHPFAPQVHRRAGTHTGAHAHHTLDGTRARARVHHPAPRPREQECVRPCTPICFHGDMPAQPLLVEAPAPDSATHALTPTVYSSHSTATYLIHGGGPRQGCLLLLRLCTL